MTTNAREEAAAKAIYTVDSFTRAQAANLEPSACKAIARAVLAAADGVAPAQGVSDEQIDALMPKPAEPSEPIMKAMSTRAEMRGDYQHVGDTPDYWSREQVRATVRAALAAFGAVPEVKK